MPKKPYTSQKKSIFGKMTAGRPKIKVDWEEIDKLLSMQCTAEEIAGFLGISYDSIERRCKEEKLKNFADYSAQKREGGKASLRRRQWLMAEKNPTMAIWLGKQTLGQKDKTENDNTHNFPKGIKIEIVRNAVNSADVGTN